MGERRNRKTIDFDQIVDGLFAQFVVMLQHIDTHIIDEDRNLQLPHLPQPLLKVALLPRTLVIHH
jgi:hypothetical protein